MKLIKTRRPKQSLARARSARRNGKCVLRLFVAGATDRSRQAVLCVRRLCDVELKGEYEMEVIDIYQQPGLARENQIVATPPLVRELPRPARRFIGNLANIADLFVESGMTVRTKTAP
jgi:circadian clock protein KaiB